MASPTWTWIVTVSFDWATPTAAELDLIEAGLVDLDGSAGRAPWNHRAEDSPWMINVSVWVDDVVDPVAALAAGYARIIAAAGTDHPVIAVEVVGELLFMARAEA